MIIFLKNLFNFLTDSAYNLNYETKSKAGLEIIKFKAQKNFFPSLRRRIRKLDD